jgi:6-oxo-cyclohex-1-ene-carbonyl-CoA hydrolase
MKSKNLVTKVVPVLRKDGQWVRNPLVRTDTYVEDGEIVYGEAVAAEHLKAAKDLIAQCTTDFAKLDRAVDELVWKFTNLFPGCLMKSIDGIRAKKKFFWDQMKLANRHWLAANMNYEAWLGFSAFDAKKITGTDVIDFVKYRQLVAQGAVFDEDFATQVLAKPKV